MTAATAPRFGRGRAASSALLLIGGFLLATAGAALAFWTVNVLSDGSSYALAQADTLSAPPAATATANGSGAITIGWTLPTAQLVGAQYQVARTSPGPVTNICTVVSSVSSCQDSGLTSGTIYSYSVSAILGGWESSSTATSATTATPTFAITLSTSSPVAGSSVTVQQIQAKVGSTTDSTYSGPRTIAWSGLVASPAGQPPSYPAGSVSFVSGTAMPGTFFTAYRSGSNTLTATDANSTAVAGSVIFNVSAAAASNIATVAGSGQTTAVNAAFADPLVAVVTDTYGNHVPGATVTFTAPGSGPSGTFANTTRSTTAATGVNGQAITSALTANATAGMFTVSAGASGTNTVSFALTNTAGAATQVVLTGGATLVSGTAQMLTATIQDAAGNTVTAGADSTKTVTFAKSSGAGTVSGLGTATARDGVATISVTGSTAGAVNLQAEATLSSGVRTSNILTVTVTAGSATTVAIVSGSGQAANVDSAFTNPLIALVKDTNGNLVAGATVIFAAPASGASGTFVNTSTRETTAVTGPNGQATSSTLTANGTAGSVSVSATANGTNTVSFALGNTTSGTTLTLSPSSGSANILVTLTGDNWTNNSALTATFNGTAVALSNATTKNGGNIGSPAVKMTVPALPSGTYLVVVTDAGGKAAAASFTIN